MRWFFVLSLLNLYISLISSVRINSKSQLDCSPHHNDHRKNLLDHDDDLAERALELARIYETNQLNGRKTEGINYYTESMNSNNDYDDDYLCEAAVSSWFDEVAHYDSLNSDARIRQNKNKYFHYMQLSWNTTESVGCGYAQSNNRFTVACVYRNKMNINNSIRKHIPVNSFEKEILKKNHKDLCHLGPVFYDYTQSQDDKTKVHNKIMKVKQYCANRDYDDDNYYDDNDYDNDDDYNDDYDGRQNNNRRRNQDDDEEDFNNDGYNGRNNKNNNRNNRNNQNQNQNKNNTRNDPNFKKLNDKLDRLEKLVQNLKNSSRTNNNNNYNNNNNNKNKTKRRRIVRRRLVPFPF